MGPAVVIGLRGLGTAAALRKDARALRFGMHVQPRGGGGNRENPVFFLPDLADLGGFLAPQRNLSMPEPPWGYWLRIP